ncbi:LamG-like jellyroll fold domain-containing protein [Clostridium sporogenes]|uniref:LamG-like jellyroll fold domain-containing protein n=1 Tax=Clostridium sporogenes TaxID=1509 RepID=UPI0013D3DDD3
MNKYALNFNRGYSIIPISNSDFIYNQYTIEMWFKAPSGNTRRFFIESSSDFTISIGFQTDGTIEIYTNQNNFKKTTKIYDDNKFHHLAYVFNKGVERCLYIDGEKVIDSFDINSFGTFSKLVLGSYRDYNDRWFQGSIDELRIWNIARNINDIIRNANAIVNPHANGLLGYWRIDEGVKNTVYDLTSNNRNIIINGDFNWTNNSAPIDYLKKYLIKQNSNYYSINNNYIDLEKIDNSEELYNIIDEYGYDDLSIITKELDNKKIPIKLENDYYKSFDINLNDIKDTINLIEENDKKYIEYSCSNYKISDKIKKINNAKFEVLMKE